MGGPQAALLEAPTLTTGVDHWKPWSADSKQLLGGVRVVVKEIIFP